MSNPPANEHAVIRTSYGEITLAFWSDVAPKTVENFKKLAREGFYDGTAFHRIIKGFMIQDWIPAGSPSKGVRALGVLAITLGGEFKQSTP